MAGVGDNSASSGKTPSESYNPSINVLSNEIISTDIQPILNNPIIHDSVKQYVVKAQTVVSALNNFIQKQSDDRRELVEKYNTNNNLLRSMQAQIKELKNNQSTVIKSTYASDSAPINRKTKTVQSKSLKYTNSATIKAAPKQVTEPSTPGISTTNKFTSLEDDDQSANDGDDSESSDCWVDYNSDPEFSSKRRAIRAQLRKTPSKRKRANTSASSHEEQKPGQSGETQPNSQPSVKDSINTKKLLPPPPIKIIGIEEYSTLMELIVQKNIKKDDIRTKIINNSVWQVNPKDDATAKIILNSLRDAQQSNIKLQFYTHCNKNLRDIKVIVRGLHPTLDESEILLDLQSKGFKAKKATCLMKRVPLTEGELKNLKKQTEQEKLSVNIPNKIPTNSVSKKNAGNTPTGTPSVPNVTPSAMETNASETMVDVDNEPIFAEDTGYINKTKVIKIPVHQVDFDHTDDIEKIYKIVGICSMAVKVEPIKVSSTKIIQCRRCQSYGHSWNFCGKQARCVKCAGKHLSADCPWAKRIVNPRCVNCGGWGHPASYRGCPFAKTMQKERLQSIKGRNQKKLGPGDYFPALPDKNKSNKNNFKSHSSPSNRNIIKPGVSFANAMTASSDTLQSGNKHQEELISQLLMTIESLRKQLEEMSKRQEKYEAALLGQVINKTSRS